MSRHPGAAAFSDLAALVGGGPESVFLADVLADAAGGIAFAARAEAKSPSAEQLRNKLEHVERAGSLLFEAIKDPSILGRLEAGGSDVIDLSGKLDWLEDLSNRSRAAILAIPTAKRKKPWPQPDALTATTTCALVIYHLWVEVNGRSPGVSQSKAWQACNMLWQGAGQPPIGFDLDGWRYHLTNARSLWERVKCGDPHGGSPVELHALRVVQKLSESVAKDKLTTERQLQRERVKNLTPK